MSQQKAKQRLESYPERFRARVGGRVTRITASAPGMSPFFEAELLVERSKPLPPAKTHPLTGMPLAEVSEENMDEQEEISADTTELPVSDFQASLESVPGFLLRRFSVQGTPEKNLPLYPDFPPLKAGEKICLRWHGQREVPGIITGSYIRCSGMLSLRKSPATIFNPRYEIVPARIIESMVI